MLSAIRRRRPGEADSSPDRRQPVPLVHVDQTTASSIARVHRHLPASDAPKLLERRFQIINLWRPIANPAVDWPLALCDFRTVDLKKDTFPVALIYPDREGETLGVKYNKNHKWKYLHGMTPEEIVLIKWRVHFFLIWIFGYQFESDLSTRLALIPSKTGALPFAHHIPLSVTQQLPREHPFASQLNSGPLYFMTEKVLYTVFRYHILVHLSVYFQT